jgi:quinol-cytochrome oxidoreductase complex cytochrome b subunit
MHVVITAGILGFIVLVHLGQVRRRGVVPPPGEENLEVDVTTLHQPDQVEGTQA